MYKMPLKRRLSRLDSKKPNCDKRNINMVKTMANMPIGTFLVAFDKQLNRLMELLGQSPNEGKNLPYKNIAYLVSQLDWDLKDEAIKILALPFQRCAEERTIKNGKNSA